LRHALFALLVASLFASPGFAAAEPPYPVGLKQIEFTDGERQLALAMFYPAAFSDSSAKPTGLPFFTNLHLYRDAGLGEGRHPLVMLSHGRGSNPLQYAWFAETPASQGYIVAGLYHYRANTYDQSIAYLSNKIWQRPRDISSAIDFLLKDPVSGKAIDAERIGVAGHSQGGFTRSASAAPRSMPTNSSPSSRTGRTISRFRPICVTSCRSIPRLRSTCAIRASRRPSP
jgi:hypothetical protein